MTQTVPGLQQRLRFNLLTQIWAGVHHDPVLIITRGGNRTLGPRTRRWITRARSAASSIIGVPLRKAPTSRSPKNNNAQQMILP